jgi:secreted PhoX family phosphatase
VHGTGALTAANGFEDQGDVVIEARRAADLVGATRMDRPEDVEANPVTGKVYVALTNNERRPETGERPERPGPDPANPRAKNAWGHLVELTNPDGDHAATRFTWDMLVRCGDPRRPEVQALWNPATSANGWFACPDNMAIDHQGRLWVGTDQGAAWAKTSGTADGVWAVETEDALRGTGRMFFRAPVGAEICGCLFLPGDTAMTIAVQHPGIDGVKDWKPFGRESTFADPATRWPDFNPGMPPRPSVVLITREDGGKIG